MEKEFIKIVRVTLSSLLVFVAIFVAKTTYIDVDNHLKDDRVQQMEKAMVEHTTTIKMLNNYIDWRDCINSDVDCQICDSLYNINGDFVY